MILVTMEAPSVQIASAAKMQLQLWRRTRHKNALDATAPCVEAKCFCLGLHMSAGLELESCL